MLCQLSYTHHIEKHLITNAMLYFNLNLDGA